MTDISWQVSTTPPTWRDTADQPVSQDGDHHDAHGGEPVPEDDEVYTRPDKDEQDAAIADEQDAAIADGERLLGGGRQLLALHSR